MSTSTNYLSTLLFIVEATDNARAGFEILSVKQSFSVVVFPSCLLFDLVCHSSFKSCDNHRMAESLKNLPVYKKDSFTNFVPSSQNTQSRITYVCTSKCNRSWTINSGRPMLYDLSLDTKREQYILSQTRKDDTDSPPNKMPRLSAL
ncbi:unnamed protein product [Trichobilharzia szidati]|nr:unnamed protein product [Trichobilharzia szidati]